MRWLQWVMVLFVVGGCAFIKQDLKIAPELTVSEENVGGGQAVYLKVVDDRENSTIGKRGSAYGPAASISSKQDVVEIIREQVTTGLTRKGFRVVEDSQSAKEVRVEIRTLSYDTDMGFWTAGNIGKSAIKVIVKGDKEFEKMYRDEREIRTAFVASQETNAKVINGAVAGVLEKMFADKELLEEIKK